MNDQYTPAVFDQLTVGDIVAVKYDNGEYGWALTEGEFVDWGRSKSGTWFLTLRGVMPVPTRLIQQVWIRVPAGCL